MTLFAISLSLNANDVTKEKIIDRIQVGISSQGGEVNYYFYNGSGWGAEGCPHAVYAYMKESDKGAKAILSLAMSAKASGSNVKFVGTCGDDAGNKEYLRARYMYQF